METFLVWTIFIIVVSTFAFYQVAPKYWLPGIGVLLFIYTYFHFFNYFLLIFFGLIWLCALAFFIFSKYRLQYFTIPFFNWFRHQQPSLSKTEQEVLESGGLWWEREFFTGAPRWQKLFEKAPPSLTTEEQAFLDGPVNTLCELLNDWEICQNHDFPEVVWQYIKKERFWGLVIDKAYGGHGFSANAHSRVIAKIASRSYSAAVSIMVPNSLGPAEFIQHFGTDQQKSFYLRRLAYGDEVPCFALTAPNAGSDAVAMADRGVVCRDIYEGKEVLGIRINFDKRYITLAPIATLIGLAFRLLDPDHLLGEQDDLGITLAIIPSHLQGIEIGKRHNPLNLGFMNGPIRGKDVFIPIELVIGGMKGCGDGWRMLMECLSIGRAISLPALSSGISQFCFRMSGAYAKIRRQFHRPIGDFEGIQDLLSKIAGFTYINEAARSFAAQAVDAGARPAVASAITKYHTTELLRLVVSNSTDLHGGKAIQLGPLNYLALLYFAIPINITVEGANVLTRNLIIFGQGVLRCHPYLRDEIACIAQYQDEATQKRFDKLLLQHVGFFISRFVRGIVYGWTKGALIHTGISDMRSYYLRQLTLLSNVFVIVTDISLAILGGKLKFKESLSARLGDILSYLYLASAVLQKSHNDGSLKQHNDILQWSLDYCLFQIQQSFNQFFHNFPQRWLANILKVLFLPWLSHYSYPEDKLSFELAKKMQSDLDFRDQISKLCYSSPTGVTEKVEGTLKNLIVHAELLNKLEQLFIKEKTSRTLAEKIKAAYNEGKISTDEYSKLLELEKDIGTITAVNEFDSLLK